MTPRHLHPDLLPDWLTVLRSVMPPSGCLVLGAGNGSGPIVQWLIRSDVPRVSLVEAVPALHQQLQRHLPVREGWTVHREVVSPSESPATYYEVNLPSANGLHPAEALHALWPHLKLLHAWQEDHPVTLATLLKDADDPVTWLMIDHLGSAALLDDVSLDSLDVVLARVVVSPDASVPDDLRQEAWDRRLQISGLMPVVAFDDRHPAMAWELWARDIQALREQIGLIRTAGEESRERVRELQQASDRENHEREQALQKLAALHKDNAQLQQDNAQLQQDNAHLQQDNAHLQQDNTRLQQDNTRLQQDNVQLQQANAQLKQDNAELQRRLDELLNAQHQQLIDSCVSTEDLHQRVERLLVRTPADSDERFHLLVSIADRLHAGGDQPTALSYLEQARMGLSSLSPDQLETCINRLVAMGQPAMAEQLFTQAVLDGGPPLTLSDADRAALQKVSQQIHAAYLQKSEHGHDLLLVALRESFAAYRQAISPRRALVIEIGSTREDVPGQGSTQKLADFCHREGADFVTVDMDPHNSEQAAKLFAARGWKGCKAVTMKGEDFLAQHEEPIDFVFLDAYDFDHGQHSELRQSRYERFLGSRISDAECHRMHLECARLLAQKLAPHGLLCLDDTWLADGRWTAKGTLAMPWLLDNGFELVEARNRAALLRRAAVPLPPEPQS